MFKNCVFKPDVNTVKWLQKTGIRVIRTMAETALGVIGTTAVVSEVNWVVVASSSALSGIVAILLAVKGIPEVESEQTEKGE